MSFRERMSDRVRDPRSDSEMHRRWQLVKNLLKEKNIDAIFAQNSNMFLGGYVRWFTDVPAEHNMPMTVIFNQEEEITLIHSGAVNLETYPPVYASRANYEVINAPYASTLNFTADVEVNIVIDHLKKHAYKRVGYINPAMIPIRLMNRLRGALPEVEFVNLTDEIDLFKALKSHEEMECIRETARIHDALWSALPSIMKPGMYEYQIRASIIELLSNLGSEESLIFLGTAQPGIPCGMATFEFANKIFEKGDYGLLLVEVSGPGGYYCESARDYCSGEPTSELAKMWDVVVAAQSLTEKILIPGQNATEIVKEYNRFVGDAGYSLEGRLYGHSQGYDLIERPAFMVEYDWGYETMPVMAGMNCSLHPFIQSERYCAYINSNYYVGEDGLERLHKTPNELIIL